ncbi:UDP-glucose/GDP-mannose dehydrogenase family protein [Flagellimonas halotolerans]|uniref:UDP-glucose 6-dehydrogenase n=1 Tax=Flagellimonas halotolerans TaxID=3112164 RepID=A0ABU6ISS4_9FLAO|nr:MULTISPECIES: UDP-glucose/GDP-mannose dehydrogenase family protein [unclassified Allomuricauda]MEC3966157.1 UDP-glucose/GDP-mannose dehydrogenase family protein [Muricauda sp. SYSU M86414]MEC4266022.1 UDP-glucose/GDP-mannose dehydrogenase family protein [Muricauda sp. SYSU M84420]
MNLTIIGTGYVGLVTGTCFAEMGNTVTCVDIDKQKIENLEKGIIPIYEPGLDAMVTRNVNNQTLRFHTDLQKSLDHCDMAFIAVGTPMGEDGSADLQYVLDVAKSIGKYINQPIIIVDKSTVPVGTADKVKDVVASELKNRGVEIEFQVVSNPEFLKEGDAINDFMKPDRVVVGTEDKETAEKMRQLYAPFFRSSMDRMLVMDVRSAEMTKYVANAMLATKISFMNEIANICELVGADVNKVRIGIGSDSRIGYSFIYPGSGYGGSCFPKDVKALKKTAEQNGYSAQLLSAVEDVNNRQKLIIADKVISHFGSNLSNKTFAVWGLSFKPGTDDMREAPSIYIINKLIALGAKIQAYDPKAIDEAKEFYLKDISEVSYAASKYDVLKNADALLMLTEWKEFRSPDFMEIKNNLKSPVIFDGRNQYDSERLQKMGFEYYQIGKN